MNEKINKLWDKAVNLIQDNNDGDWSLDACKDKFAELLFNEIANTAVISDGMFIGNERRLSVELRLGDMVKKISVFGVEE
jgi:hypothetical protein